MGNDIWGLQYDKGEMAKVFSGYDVPLVLMHNQDGTHYDRDIIESMKTFLERTVE